MGWATYAIEALQRGETVTIRPHGDSMRGRVNDEDRVTLKPAHLEQLAVGDVILVRVRGNIYLHLIKARNGNRFLIGNNRGRINGWVGPNAVYGVATDIEPS
ncbi:MAG TPA: S24 family peptidase [Aggregatilinea sp.]|jgi:phage repressor protein C with HTH and peptisase S24 domain|uniref:S24 family peptidase n=1 Tax=Aggregatilinea sp. TaxID=2806333 RepID=UPI002C2D6B42|nr:S24 family peptidase [Aggregatilinea sp.]HML20766.1 S24 family peptidase [Aggregatilinea sp.]